MRSNDPLEIDIWNLRRLLERLSSGVLRVVARAHLIASFVPIMRHI